MLSWRTAPVKDKLLTLIVMVGALVAYWVVMFQQYRKRSRPGSRHYDSVMPAAKAVAMARPTVMAIPGITAAAMRAVVMAGAEVTAAAAVGIETQALVPVD